MHIYVSIQEFFTVTTIFYWFDVFLKWHDIFSTEIDVHAKYEDMFCKQYVSFTMTQKISLKQSTNFGADANH